MLRPAQLQATAAPTPYAPPATSGAIAAWPDVHLVANGMAVHLRMIAPGDLEREREFVHGLSPRTRYQRLMSARTPSAEELRRWTDVDRSREGAVVATVDIDGFERQVGVARYFIDQPDAQADFAIVVADEWQGMGLGRQLLTALVDLARQSGVRKLVGTTMSENKGMIALGRSFGFRPSREPGAAIYTLLSLSLQPEC
ncbi:GNAT family N-acetyltransferase [Variovorax sp. OV329]|uniref:GNAT family N-acetyltransferase n=1 Tax=Variovorax sp. OV329 TaxID=1882825 RepID=UPI0008EE54F8|nr:GNAT family N-acetyltransferase [Variovorax sp. OV329]SFM20239.1 acetyltransferase [Variovorax sp. OV329]